MIMGQTKEAFRSTQNAINKLLQSAFKIYYLNEIFYWLTD